MFESACSMAILAGVWKSFTYVTNSNYKRRASSTHIDGSKIKKSCVWLLTLGHFG